MNDPIEPKPELHESKPHFPEQAPARPDPNKSFLSLTDEDRRRLDVRILDAQDAIAKARRSYDRGNHEAAALQLAMTMIAMNDYIRGLLKKCSPLGKVPDDLCEDEP